MIGKVQLKKSFSKHPFSKKRLLVLDDFPVTADVPCPVCAVGKVKNILVVESETPGGKRYNVLSCSQCPTPIWCILK